MAGAGDLTQRVVIQQGPAAATQARAKTWSTLATVWAAVRPGSSSGETSRAGAMGAENAYEVEIQYRADVTPKMRLSWTPYGGSAKSLEIKNVHRKAGVNRRLILACAEAA